MGSAGTVVNQQHVQQYAMRVPKWARSPRKLRCRSQVSGYAHRRHRCMGNTWRQPALIQGSRNGRRKLHAVLLLCNVRKAFDTVPFFDFLRIPVEGLTNFIRLPGVPVKQERAVLLETCELSVLEWVFTFFDCLWPQQEKLINNWLIAWVSTNRCEWLSTNSAACTKHFTSSYLALSNLQFDVHWATCIQRTPGS